MFFLGACAAFGAFIWGMFEYFMGKVIEPIKEIKTDLEEHKKETLYQITEIHTKITEVSKEVNFNGGKSMKDIQQKIYTTVKVLEDRDTFNFYLDSQPKFECDSNGLCVRVNDSFSELTGLSEHQSLGNGWLRCISDLDSPHVLNAWELFIQKDLPFNVSCKIKSGEDVLIKAVSKRSGIHIHIIIGSIEKK